MTISSIQALKKSAEAAAPPPSYMDVADNVAVDDLANEQPLPGYDIGPASKHLDSEFNRLFWDGVKRDLTNMVHTLTIWQSDPQFEGARLVDERQNRDEHRDLGYDFFTNNMGLETLSKELKREVRQSATAKEPTDVLRRRARMLLQSAQFLDIDMMVEYRDPAQDHGVASAEHQMTSTSNSSVSSAYLWCMECQRKVLGTAWENIRMPDSDICESYYRYYHYGQGIFAKWYKRYYLRATLAKSWERESRPGPVHATTEKPKTLEGESHHTMKERWTLNKIRRETKTLSDRLFGHLRRRSVSIMSDPLALLSSGYRRYSSMNPLGTSRSDFTAALTTDLILVTKLFRYTGASRSVAFRWSKSEPKRSSLTRLLQKPSSTPSSSDLGGGSQPRMRVTMLSTNTSARDDGYGINLPRSRSVALISVLSLSSTLSQSTFPSAMFSSRRATMIPFSVSLSLKNPQNAPPTTCFKNVRYRLEVWGPL